MQVFQKLKFLAGSSKYAMPEVEPNSFPKPVSDEQVKAVQESAITGNTKKSINLYRHLLLVSPSVPPPSYFPSFPSLTFSGRSGSISKVFAVVTVKIHF